MILINLFIAFFVIVALGISWLVLNFVFGTEPTPALIGDKEAPSAPEVKTKQPVAIATEAPPKTTKRKKYTCRDQVVAAAKAVTRETGVNEFTAKEIVEYLIKNGTDYSTSTIRTHIASRCCANSTNGNGNTYNDFERVERGRYRLVGN